MSNQSPDPGSDGGEFYESEQDDIPQADPDDLSDLSFHESDVSDEPEYEDPDTAQLVRGPYGGLALDELSSSDDEAFNLAALEEEMEIFQTNVRGDNRRRGRPRGATGPRKQAEPSQEIQILLRQANQAYINEDLDTALDIIHEIIRQNAEIYNAWTTLGEIFREQGEMRKSLMAFVSAAHLRPKESDLWAMCAQRSLDLREEDSVAFLKQAIYCYTRAIRANPKDVWLYYHRAKLLLEDGQIRRALAEFNHVLKLLPHNMMVLNEMAKILMEAGHPAIAAEKFETAFEHCLSQPLEDDELFTFSDINVYAELLNETREYEQALRAVKTLSRWVLGRGEQSFWDDEEDDREWDLDDNRRILTRGFDPREYPPKTFGTGLPFELRIKMGSFRLRCNRSHLSEAMNHFNWLNPGQSGEGSALAVFPDLFRDTAAVLEEVGYYEQALLFYEPLLNEAGLIDTELLFKAGKCYRETNNTTAAKLCYNRIVSEDEENIPARLELADLYEKAQKPDQAYEYISQVMRLRREQTQKGAARAAELRKSEALIQGTQKRKPGKISAVTMAERAEEEKRRSERFQAVVNELQITFETAFAGSRDDLLRWIDAAREIIEDFSSSPAFYTYNNRHVRFQGYSRRHTSERQQDMQIQEVAGRLENSIRAEMGPVPTEYRGISFSSWLDLFLQYALMWCKLGEVNECYETLDTASNANIFHHSEKWSKMIYSCYVACALYNRDEETCSQTTRWFHRQDIDDDNPLRLFGVLHRLCQPAITRDMGYNSTANQKYFLRQIKFSDEKAIDDVFPLRPVLLMLYGHIMLCGGSVGSALNYFFRAYNLEPSHPLVSLSIGVSYLIRAMRRTAINRHFHILQGFAFMLKYYEIRKASARLVESQEASYNMARAYHSLGLTNLAVPFYEEALELSSAIEGESYTAEAAVNLQAIYVAAGNMEMSMLITKTYLSW